MRRALSLGWTLLLGSVTALAAPAPPPERAPVAFVGVHVIPMDSNRLLRDQTVVVSGGRIQAVGPAGRTPIPKGARVVRAAGQYLMPGLADMHVHLYAPEELTLNVANGVTTVFNLDGRPVHLLWRQRIAAGELLGPAIYSAGPMFNRRRTPEEAIAEVDRQAAAGYDAVKIYNQVGKAEYPALTAEAKKKNLILIGHVAREPGFAATLAAGQSIAHAEEFLYTFFNDGPHPEKEIDHPLDEKKIPKAVALSREAGISVIPTLVAFHNIVRQATALPEYLRNPDLEFLSPAQRRQLEPERNTYANRFPKDVLPALSIDYEFQRKLVKALHEGGVPILTGTDVSWLGVPGFSLIEEIENFQALGFSPFDALKAATADCARFLKGQDEFGTVAPGRRADLILLRHNPLDDVRNLRGLTGVMVRGRWIPNEERRRLLGSIPASYRDNVARLTRQAENDLPGVEKYLAENDPLGIASSAVLARLA
ncbi:MAG TPA: amidohydrolase family protein, partial [Thermoanaerobaculia bacterium]